MTNLSPPKGWKIEKLTSIADYYNGAAFNEKDWEEDGLPIIRIEQLNNENADTDKYNGPLLSINYIDDGDLIFSWSATLKVVIWNRGPGALNQHLYKVVPKAGIDKYLLRHLLDFNMEKLAGQSQGSTMKHVTRKELSRFKVLLPEQEVYQKKIALILEVIDQAIEKTEALIHKYRQIKAGLMHDLFTRGLTADGKLRSTREQAPELYQETPIGWIPKEWELINASDICYPVTKGTTPSYFINSNGDDSIPYIRVENLSFDGSLDFENYSLYINKAVHNTDLNRSKVYAGDILMNIVGPPLGKVSLIPDDYKEWNVNQAVAIFRVKHKKHRRYLLYYLLSELAQKWFYVRSKRTSGQVNLTLEMCSNLEIPLPKNDSELLKISNFMAKILEIITIENKYLKKLITQKSGLMHDLLTGKVPVNIDPEETTDASAG